MPTPAIVRTPLPLTLLGPVKVQPTTARPGESVLVQVCDAKGQPYADNANVRITIQGVEATSRYYQFATPGTRKLTIRAVRGKVDESIVFNVQIAGAPTAFRRTLRAPAIKAMPILHVSQNLGTPYLASFSLGTPRPISQLLAKDHLFTAPESPVAVRAPAPQKPTPYADVESPISKALSALKAEQVNKVPLKSFTTNTGLKVTGGGSFAQLAAGLHVRPQETSYTWDFGDGTQETTQSPNVTHDYFPAIHATKVPHSFHVSCTIDHDNLTVQRTLVLYSAYGLCKRRGVIVPHVTGDIFAKFQHVAFSGSLILHNIEGQAITLNKMAIVPFGKDPKTALAAPQFTAMANPITIRANSASALGVYIPLSRLEQMAKLKPSMPGFTVYYSGIAADHTPVRFSYSFRILLSDSGKASHAASSHQAFSSEAAIKTVSAIATDAKSSISKAGDQTFDPATHTMAIALTADPHKVSTLAQARSSIQAGLTSVATKLGAITATGLPVRLAPPAPGHRIEALNIPGPPSPGPVQEGQICDPDNISDSDVASASAQQLVCQLTSEVQTVLMPGSFQNALMGDIILNPGGDGADQIIGDLLRALNPPQYHTHTGIMTQNFVEITHCTATPERFADNTVGLSGSGGIQPNVLQYAWPGSITQTIDATVNGENWNDPNGKPYNIGGFTPEALGIISNGEFIMVPPMVVKPLPENENQARPTLRKVAATAQSKGARVDANGNLATKGGCYYCFYGYTKPEIAAGFSDAAPAAAGWAQGLSPAVCSSFVWLCMKENNVPLVTAKTYETPADLSPSAIAEGAEVGAGTLDGLFFYSQSERLQAAQVLDQIFQNQILNKEGFFQYIPGVSSDIASSIADQFMNMFAFNNPNQYGSGAWKDPGSANAVSPDNVPWWKAPLFGYAEPMQYLQQHTEQYTVSRWKKVVTRGTISGTVTLNGAPVKGAYVQVYDGKATTSDANGHYQLTDVPLGNYHVNGRAVVGGMEYFDQEALNLTAATATSDLKLHGLPEEYRTLDLVYQWASDHGDANPWNKHGWLYMGPDSSSFNVGPGNVTNNVKPTPSYDYNGGGYFSIEYQFTGAVTEDLSIQVTIIGTMYDTGHQRQGQQTITFNVPKDGQYAWELDLECDGFGYHNGPSKFTGTATNRQQTS